MEKARRKLAVLADAAKYDASCASGGSRRAPTPGGIGATEGMGICHSYTPDGRCVSLLKVLLTNHCIYDCTYCVNRRSSDVERARFDAEELVTLTLELYKRNHIEGLFLSSGIWRSADTTLEQLVAVARSLREEHGFGGYIHLKAPPGASDDLVAAAGRHADRVSVNIELPTARDLAALAPEKTTTDIERVMSSLAERIDVARGENAPSAPSFAPAGQSTQTIVGATPASDRETLATASRLYEAYRLRRVYYSAFSPIPHADGRLPVKAPPLVRERPMMPSGFDLEAAFHLEVEHRLYQADWLVRKYGFRADELTTERLTHGSEARLGAVASGDVSRRREQRFARDALARSRSVHADGGELSYSDGMPRSSAPSADALADVFRTYYRAIFNPARVNPRAMCADMPLRRWEAMPELDVAQTLTREAAARVMSMTAPSASASASFVPRARTLRVLRDAAQSCRACGLCERATQTVFGEGREGASLMFVGEQPGEDRRAAVSPSRSSRSAACSSTPPMTLRRSN